MNPQKGQRSVARGTALWHAPRLEGAVKNAGIKKNEKKPKREKGR